jgi:hypothetical protein
MTSLFFCLAPLTFLAAGLGIIQWLPSAKAKPLPARLAVAYLLGLAVVGGTLYAGSHLLGLPIRRVSVAGIVVVAVLAGVVRRQLKSSSIQPGRTSPEFRPAVLPVIATLVVGFVSLSVLGEAATNPVADWDGRMIWGAHARFMNASESVDPPVLREPGWVVVHPQYPALLPVIQVATWKMLGTDDERAPRTIYALFLPAFLAILYEGTRKSAGRNIASGIVMLAAMTPMLAFDNHGGAAGGYSDLPLGCFVGTGFLFLIGSRRSRSTAAVAATLLSAAVLTKNEGMPLATIAVAAALATAYAIDRSSDQVAFFRRFAVPEGVAAAAVAITFIFLRDWQRGIPNRIDEDYFSTFSMSGLIQGARDRGPEVLRLVRQQMFTESTWGYLWWILPILFLMGWSAFCRRSVMTIGLFVAGCVSVYFAAYAVTGWKLESIVNTTWNRFLVQLSLPLFCAAGACAGEAMRRPRTTRSAGTEVVR